MHRPCILHSNDCVSIHHKVHLSLFTLGAISNHNTELKSQVDRFPVASYYQKDYSTSLGTSLALE